MLWLILLTILWFSLLLVPMCYICLINIGYFGLTNCYTGTILLRVAVLRFLPVTSCLGVALCDYCAVLSLMDNNSVFLASSFRRPLFFNHPSISQTSDFCCSNVPQSPFHQSINFINSFYPPLTEIDVEGKEHRKSMLLNF